MALPRKRNRPRVGYHRHRAVATTIRVILIDAGTSTRLGEAEFPVAQLPETFEVATTLHLAGGDWQVERAEPVTRAEFAETGQLTIWMRAVVQVDPQALLYSLPTLETLQPPLGDPGDGLWMHEDDWRQIELVSARFAPEIAVELAAIRAVHAEDKRGPGFTRLHVRERIPEPLAGVELTVADLGLAAPRRDIVLGPVGGRQAPLVIGGFAFEVGDSVIYGREDTGRVVALGIRGPDTRLLVALARAHDLVLVHWVVAEALRPDGDRFVR